MQTKQYSSVTRHEGVYTVHIVMHPLCQSVTVICKADARVYIYMYTHVFLLEKVVTSSEHCKLLTPGTQISALRPARCC
jgi:hypothetical protein